MTTFSFLSSEVEFHEEKAHSLCFLSRLFYSTFRLFLIQLQKQEQPDSMKNRDTLHPTPRRKWVDKILRTLTRFNLQRNRAEGVGRKGFNIRRRQIDSIHPESLGIPQMQENNHTSLTKKHQTHGMKSETAELRETNRAIITSL